MGSLPMSVIEFGALLFLTFPSHHQEDNVLTLSALGLKEQDIVFPPHFPA